jgi:hypothetical protein
MNKALTITASFLAGFVACASPSKAEPKVSCDQTVPKDIQKIVPGFNPGAEKLIKAHFNHRLGKIILHSVIMGPLLPPIVTSIGLKDGNPDQVMINMWMDGKEITALRRAINEVSDDKTKRKVEKSGDHSIGRIVFDKISGTITASGMGADSFPQQIAPAPLDGPAKTVPYPDAPSYVATIGAAVLAAAKCRPYVLGQR